MSRTLPAPTLALLAGANRAHHQRLWIGPPGEALVNLSDYLLPGTVHEEGINEPIDMLVVNLDRSLGSSSLSPLMTADPPVDLNHDVVWEVAVTSLTAAPTSGDWIELFRGSVWDIDATHNAMVVTCQGLAGKLQERLTLAGQTIDADTELPAAIQQVLDGPTPAIDVTLAVPVSPDASLNADLAVSHQPVLRAALDLAGSIGWTARYWWDEYEEDFLFTLLEPPRDKVTPDWTTSASRYIAVPEFRRSKADVRNFVTVYYGPPDADGVQASVTAFDTESIDEFGLLEAFLREGSDSPIQNEAQAQALADAFISDMAWPDVTHTITDFDLPQIRLWDLIELAPNDVHYNTTQRYAVQSIRREFPTMGAARITLGLRGKPSAGVGTWKRRQTTATAPELANTYGFRVWNEIPTGDPSVRRWEYEAGSQVAEVWAASRSYAAELSEGSTPPEEDIALHVEPLGATSGTVEMTRPRGDQISILRVEPRVWVGDRLIVYDQGEELIKQVVWYPEPAVTNGFIDAVESGGLVSIAVSANPTATALPIAWEVREDGKAGTLLASGVWSSQAQAQAGATSASHAGLGGRAVPSVGKRSWFAKFTNVVDSIEWHSDTISNPTVGGIGSDAQFSTGYDPIRYVDDLLTPGVRDGQRVILRTTKVAYAWDASEAEWVETELDADGPFFAPALVANSVTAEMVAALTFEVGKYIQSANYDPLTSGWHIGGDGDAEFNSVLIRDEVDKTMRIPSTMFSAILDTQTWMRFAGGITPRGVGTGDFYAAVVLPMGAVITGFRMRMKRETVADAATATLRAIDEDGGSTTIASVAVESGEVGAYVTKYDDVSDVVVDDEAHFTVWAVLTNSAATADAVLLWAEIDYTVENYRQTL